MFPSFVITCEVLVTKSEGKKPLGHPGGEERMVIKQIINR
jgi:hypothetical protein